jgi:hypothetical protein
MEQHDGGTREDAPAAHNPENQPDPDPFDAGPPEEDWPPFDDEENGFGADPPRKLYNL